MAEILGGGGGGVKFGGLAIFDKIHHTYTCQIPFKANLLNVMPANFPAIRYIHQTCCTPHIGVCRCVLYTLWYVSQCGLWCMHKAYYCSEQCN